MEIVGNYWLFWSVYLGAATTFYFIFWKVCRFERAIWTSYSLRAVAAAVIFTPWYSNQQDSLMAPALMVVTLDAITIGTDSAFRASVPLALAITFSLVVAGLLSVLSKRKIKKTIKTVR
jgi:hypothetical protein